MCGNAVSGETKVCLTCAAPNPEARTGPPSGGFRAWMLLGLLVLSFAAIGLATIVWR
jgi:hypothetical protein